MADDLDDFAKEPQGSYEGVAFAVLSVQILTGSAAAFHRFPYRPGQKVEPLGREPVSGVIHGAMFNTLRHQPGGAQNVMWPTGTQLLREKVQAQRTGKLVIPGFGILLKAYVRLHETMNGTARNGAFIQLDFIEDSALAIEKGFSSSKGQLSALADNANFELAASRIKLKMAVEDAESRTGTATDLLSSVKALTASLNQLDLDLQRPVRQAQEILGAIDELLETDSRLKHPSNWAARDSMLAMKDSLQDVVEDTLAALQPITSYLTIADMNLAGLAVATGNTIEELLQLNFFSTGAYDIPAGLTVLIYAGRREKDHA